MDEKVRRRVQLDCLYEMFRDRVEENVIYIVYIENDGQIDETIDHLMSISSCSLTGHVFEPPSKPKPKPNTSRSLTQINNNKLDEEGDQTDRGIPQGSIDERIERLQASINELVIEKQASHDKASQYLSKKMFPVTSYYSELSSQLRRMIETKTSELVDMLIEKCEDSDSIDLHGLNPVQARQVVGELLEKRTNKLMIDKQGEATIDIITGWGKHSATQGHRVRPTIVALLRERGLEYYRLNKGALRVTLRRC